MEEVRYLPGQWIDFLADNLCVIREADGTLVAGDLYVTKEDAEKVRRKIAREFKKAGK